MLHKIEIKTNRKLNLESPNQILTHTTLKKT